jgi:amidophosphoribosyltransferase
MTLQSNRGQDGIGISAIRYHSDTMYINTVHAINDDALEKVSHTIEQKLRHNYTNESLKKVAYIGHIRYSTYAGIAEEYCQPIVHSTKSSLCLAGNFNITNSADVCTFLHKKGIDTLPESDTGIIIELINYFWDQESKDTIDHIRVLKKTTELLDGGYVFAGCFPDGTLFVYRDPAGIRPCFCYTTDTHTIIASERSAIQEVYACSFDEIKALEPGHLILIASDSTYIQTRLHDVIPARHCIFEQIYFSCAKDPIIYAQRKELGMHVAASVLEALQGNTQNVIFTYVPNTSYTAFCGMIEEIERLKECTIQSIQLLQKNKQKRTFISSSATRQEIVSSIYEYSAYPITPDDTIVILDDSIVRGTTMRHIIQQLAQLNPKKIIVVSATPPIMYPDCYGIDISQIGQLIAFQAAISILQKNGNQYLLDAIAKQAYNNISSTQKSDRDILHQLYHHIDKKSLEMEIANLLYPHSGWQGELHVMYQTLDGLYTSMPGYTGDWYFTGNYPTPGGYKVLDRSYLQWYQGIDNRAY